ncbi:rRNA processing/ribosome biogenesis-domain-containing protein [Glomus cerebriforme]|uniref:Pre-rRNA-processing protein RIX1 n=1 Tax=Glomus cerebriforme TaxID=658196 RepID=A0A397S9F8_9GLOM|nr:rRNA processing/ribosome biogenesis-domain-containing protein [Glomus cerebriforme]
MRDNAESSQFLTTLLANYTFNDNKIETYVPFILETITQHQLLSNKNELSGREQQVVALHKWCTRINSLLQSKVTNARWAGICFIKITLKQSEESFIQNLQSWTTTLMVLLTKPEPILILKEIITTLTELFNKTQNKPELQREITTQQLPRFNTFLIKLSGLNKELLPTILNALSHSVKNFPTIFRPVNEQTQKLCLNILLDGTYEFESELVKMAIECFTHIINFGGKLNMDYWKITLLKLVGSLNNILDRLFDAIDEDKDASKKLTGFEMPRVSEDYVVAFPILFSRFKCLSECLISLISLPTSLPVQIPVNQILDLLCRVYNIHDGSLIANNKDKTEYYTLMLGIPSLFMRCNKILSAVILSVDGHLTRHLRMISSILLKLLNNSKSRWLLRVSTYNLINLCIQKYGIGLTNFTSSSILLSFIIDDIEIIQKSQYDISINTTASTSNKKSGKKKELSSQITNSDALVNPSGIIYSQTNSDVQCSALEVLKNYLKKCGASISSNTRSSLDNVLLSRILSQNISSTYNSSNILLNEENVNMKLYECLLYSIISPSVYQPTILPHALRIFSAGQNSQSIQLQSFCSYALSICDLIFHNRLPPLERSSANTLITKQLEHTTVENISQQFYTENNQSENEKGVDNINMIGLDQSSQKTFDIISAQTSSSTMANIDEDISIDVFDGDSNTSDSKNDILTDKIDIDIVEQPQSISSEMSIENQKKRIRCPSPVGVEKELAKKKDHDRVYKSQRIYNTDEDSDDMEIPEIIMEGPDSEFEDNE